MGSISKQLFFNAPLEVVWKIWTDVEKTPDWVDGVFKSIITSATKYGPGLTWEEKGIFDGRNVDVEHKVVVWDEKKKTVIKTTLPMGAAMERIVEFKASGDQTEVTAQLEWELGMIGMFISEEQWEKMITRNFEATASNWKSKAETF